MFVIVRARASRNQMAAISAAAPASPRRPVENKIMSEDLPDLDLLVGMPPANLTPSAVPPKRTARKGTFTIDVIDGEAVQAVEVVTILRDVVEGGLIVQMGDRAYRDFSDDEFFRSSFMKVMRELSPLVKQTPKSSESPMPAKAASETKPSSDTATTAPASSPITSIRDLLDGSEDDMEDFEVPVSAPPPPKADGTMPGDLPKYSLDQEPEVVKKRGTLGRTKTEYKPVPELDIAGSIEAYLQHKLVHTPTYAQRSIHVHPAPDGGVAIEVDGQFYDGVNEVDEDGVRAFLSATIQEWQQRNIGG